MKKNFKRTMSVILAVIMTFMTLSTATVAFAADCEHKNFINVEEKAASGCEDGYTAGKLCLDCATYFEGHELQEAPHSPSGIWVHGVVKDCDEGYVRTQVCTACGETAVEETVTKHDLDTENVIVDQQKCDVIGVAHYKCKVCGEEIDEEVPAKLHSWGEDAEEGWVTIKEKDCTHNGEYRRTCKNCPYVEEKTVEATGHNYVVTDKGKLPTCTENGKTATESCVCGDKKDGSGEVIEASGHFDADGDNYCEVCNQYFTSDLPDGCYCICHHKDGILSYVWQIVLFIFQLFNIEDTCICGLPHYES